MGLGWGTPEHLGPVADPDCDQVGLSSDHASAQFEAVKPAPATGHCAFCHWQRTVGGARVIAPIAGLFHLHLLDRPELSSSRAPQLAPLGHHTSRGPPSQAS